MQSLEKSAMVGRKEQHKILCEKEDETAELLAEKAKLQRARKRKEDEIRRQKEEEERKKKEEAQRIAEEERQKREEERSRKEAEQEELRKKKDAEREATYKARQGSYSNNAPRSSALDNASGGRYVPPSRRNNDSRWGSDNDSGSRGGGNAWGSSRGDSFGGGRYEGGDRNSRSNGRWN